jgi:hypothetical protein
VEGVDKCPWLEGATREVLEDPDDRPWWEGDPVDCSPEIESWMEWMGGSKLWADTIEAVDGVGWKAGMRLVGVPRR